MLGHFILHHTSLGILTRFSLKDLRPLGKKGTCVGGWSSESLTSIFESTGIPPGAHPPPPGGDVPRLWVGGCVSAGVDSLGLKRSLNPTLTHLHPLSMTPSRTPHTQTQIRIPHDNEVIACSLPFMGMGSPTQIQIQRDPSIPSTH